MIAVDAAVLIHAHRSDSPHHATAKAALESLAARTATWAIPWPAVHEFLAVITHPRIYVPPTPIDQARSGCRRWRNVAPPGWIA